MPDYYSETGTAITYVWQNWGTYIFAFFIYLITRFERKIRNWFRRAFRSRKSQIPDLAIPKVYPIKDGRGNSVISRGYAYWSTRLTALGGMFLVSALTGFVVGAIVTNTVAGIPAAVLYGLGFGPLVLEAIGIALILTSSRKFVATREGRYALGQIAAWSGKEETISESPKRGDSGLATGGKKVKDPDKRRAAQSTKKTKGPKKPVEPLPAVAESQTSSVQDDPKAP